MLFGSSYASRPQPVKEYLNSFADFLRSVEGCVVTGSYQDHPEIGSGAFTYSRMALTKEKKKIVKDYLDKISILQRSNYRESEINGYTLFESVDRPNSGENILLWNGWVVKSGMRLIKFLANQNETSSVKLSAEFEDRIEMMEDKFDHGKGIALIKAYWPKYVSSQLSGFSFYAIRERFKDKTLEEYTAAMKQEWGLFDLDSPPEPRNRNEAKQFAKSLAGKIVLDAIGCVILVGSIEDNGFRFSGTHFPTRNQ